MAVFFDVLSGESREFRDLADPHGAQARALQERVAEADRITPKPFVSNPRPGLGTPYVVGSARPGTVDEAFK